nr:AsmA-like C-terminal region-containing protein [Bacteroidota bacterium]
LIIENKFLNSLHDFEARNLEVNARKKDSTTILDIKMNALVHSLGFNMAKGSYLKEKELEGDFRLILVTGKKIELSNIELDFDQHPFVINGHFDLNSEPMSYDLKFETQKIDFPKAVGLLTGALQSNFDSLDIAKPFDVSARIAGKMAYRVVPKVLTEFKVADSDIISPIGKLREATFSGNFSNQVNTTQLPGDTNSQFIFHDVRCSISSLTLTSSKFEVNNLIQPFVKGDVQSFFELKDLNDLTESSTISFLKGTGNLDITYDGPLSNQDTIPPSLNGSLTLVNAEIKYVPRNLLFKNVTGVMEFMNTDLHIRNLLMTAGSSNLTMNGSVINLLAMINVNPEKLTMEWTVATPDLNLNDFLSYVSPVATSQAKKSGAKTRVSRMSEKIDRMLQDGTAKLSILAGKVIYKKFSGTNLSGSVLLVGNDVFFNSVRLNHARGVTLLDGSLQNGKGASQLNLTSRVEKVNIPDLFYAFDNFGQDAITNQNMKGNMTASITMNGALTQQGQVLENSMKGSVDFNLKDGELNNFAPIMSVGAKAFKNRDFSSIQFGDLTSRLDIHGSAIILNKMEIRSNVGVLFVEGLYDTKKGTDMSIQVPVSNLSKEENEDLENTGRAGVNLRLRAKTGADGKLNISWDPFNKASKERTDAASDSGNSNKN